MVLNRIICVLVVGSCGAYGLGAFGQGADGTDDGTRKLTSAERQVVVRGAAWGYIDSLADGSLGMAYSRATPVPECDGTYVSYEWVRSTDGGRTWSKPTLIAERSGADGEPFLRRPNGGYIVYQDRGGPVLGLPGGRVMAFWLPFKYYYDKDGQPENRPGKNYPHEHDGMYYTWSDDQGETWAKGVRFPVAGATIINPVTLEDGTIIVGAQAKREVYDGPLRQHMPADAKFCIILLRSVDGGQTWSHDSIIRPRSGGYGETSLCVVNEQLWLAHVRTAQGNVVQYNSRDQGRSWTGPKDVTRAKGGGSAGQHPGWVLRLASGNLLATWGNRRAPYGAGAMLSYDDGETWDYEHRVSLAWDAPGQNCGYGNPAQTAAGDIIVTYYTMPSTSNYHDLWS